MAQGNPPTDYNSLNTLADRWSKKDRKRWINNLSTNNKLRAYDLRIVEGRFVDDRVEAAFQDDHFINAFQSLPNFDSLAHTSRAERNKFYNDWDGNPDAYLESLTPQSSPQEQVTTFDPSQFDPSQLQLNDDFGITDNPYARQMAEMQQSLQEVAVKNSAYRKALEKYAPMAGAGENLNSKYTQDIKEIAYQVSPYYRKYVGTDKLTLTTPEWNQLMAEYMANYETYGEQGANEWLNRSIRDNVASNQSLLEKGAYAVRGFGADAVGTIITASGMVWGLGKAITGNGNDVEGLNGFQNFMSTVLDNEVTRYGNDVITYGTMFHMDEAKKLGLSELEIMNTSEQAQQFLSINTPFELLQQGGFTVASMFIGVGEAKIAHGLFKGVGKGLAATTSDLAKANRIMQGAQRAENFTNKFIIPGLVGTTEGAVEGLQTKLNVQEDEYKKLAEMQRQLVEQEVQNRINELAYSIVDKNDEVPIPKYYNRETGEQIDYNTLYNQLFSQVWAEYEPKFKDAMAQVDYAANIAGINNFFMNSAVNGLMNSTFKAGLQAAPIQRSLRNSRLTGWAYNLGDKAPKWVSTPYQLLKEPMGEFIEEYTQNITDATATSGAQHNISTFIENKYNGDASAAVGDNFAGDWGAAWTTFKGELVSKESLKAGTYGALSSILGVPSFGHRTNRLDEYGNVILDEKGKPQKTYFGRGQSVDGDLETRWEAIQRMTPWRSGAVANYKNLQRERQIEQQQAQAVQEWLADPENAEKFNGLIGTLSWNQAMEEAASHSDEFGYRNSSLGKAVSDAFMLNAARDTEQGQAMLEQLQEIANLEVGSDEAQQYVDAIRANVNSEMTEMSDQEIMETLTKNAQKQLDFIEKVNTESEHFEKLLGNIDNDTKQALIYGQLAINDWTERAEQLKKELAELNIHGDGSVNSSLDRETKELIARYGGLEGLRSEYNALAKSAESLRNKLAGGEYNETNAAALLLNKYEKVLKQLSKVEAIQDTQLTGILTKDDIMALDPISRAQMILRGKSDLYQTLYGEDEEAKKYKNKFNDEQQRVIDELVAEGIAKDKDFLAKIVDQGRIEYNKQRFLKQFNSVLLDTKGFKRYVDNVKQQTADALTTERAKTLLDSRDYQSFATALDRMLEDVSSRERGIISKEASKSDFYEEYKRQGKLLSDLAYSVNFSENFKDLDGNSGNLFLATAKYLAENGVDLNDTDAIWDALNNTDTDGYNNFVKYISELNEGINPEEQLVFTSIPEVFQTYKDVLNDVNERTATQESLHAHAEVDPHIEQPAPVVPPTPQVQQPEVEAEERPKSIFDIAQPTPEGGRTPEEMQGKPIEVERKPATVLGQALQDEQRQGKEVSRTEEQNEENPIVSSFKTNSGDEVSKKIKRVLNSIKSANNTEASENIVKQIFDDLSKTQQTVESLKEALDNRANQLETQDNDDSLLAASMLRRATSLLQQSDDSGLSLYERNRLSPIYSNPNPSAGYISTMDIASARKRYPNSPTVKWYDRHHIEDYLSDDNLTGESKIYFISDENLTDEIKQYNEANGIPYRSAIMPIIAAVEDANGTYEIDGKHYQPIALMPANDVKYSMGSAHMSKIRNLANPQGVSLVEFEGKPLVTRPHGKSGGVRATSRDVNNRVRTNIQTIFDNDFSAEERADLEGKTKTERRKSSAYQRAKRRFISHLGVGTTDKGHRMVAYMQPNMKNDGKNTIFAFISSVENTTGRDTDRTILETITQGTKDEVLHFNSRTSRVEKGIKKFLSNVAAAQEGNGDYIELVQGMADSLQQTLNRYLYLSPTTGYKYSINAIKGSEGIIDGERAFTISLVNEETKDTIELATFHKGSNAEDVAYSLISNLFSNGGELRKAGNKPIVSWQVDYHEVEAMQEGDNKAKDTVSDWIDDGILELDATSLNYDIRVVEIEAPFRSNGRPTFQEVANVDNANDTNNMGKPINGVEEVGDKNGTVDGDNGAILDGKPVTPKNEALITAEQKVQEITSDAPLFELSEDGRTYRNTETGRVYTRVTSIIGADVTGERFEDTGYGLPSTNIGTSVDEFVRDFFAGTLKESYPNATPQQWETFKHQLENMKLQMEANGFHIVPRDVVAAGSLEVQDANGRVVKINVAGTCDLLAYDNNGNFYIFDMKTVRKVKTIKYKKHKWSQQTSLYQRFLEDTYGIKVKGRYIIPIEVRYPAPNEVEYSQGDGNQLIANNEPYQDANPNLLHTVSVPYYEANIDYNKLTEQEKELAESLKSAAEDGNTDNGETIQSNPVEAAPAAPETPYVDPILGATMSTDSMDLFGGMMDPSLTGQIGEQTYVPNKPSWESLTQEQKDTLTKMGFSEQSYMQLDTQEEWEHIKECLGL